MSKLKEKTIDFDVPKEIQLKTFKLVYLNESLIDSFYNIISDAKDHIKEILKDTWPYDESSKEKNLEELLYHHQDFKEKKAYAYGAFIDDKQVGCLYINPIDNGDYDALVYLWTYSSKLDYKLYEEVKDWIKECWPLDNVGYLNFEINKKF